jgi:hypothetical protein
VLRPRDADRDRKPDARADFPPQALCDLRRWAGEAAKSANARNASSIESPSTSGVVSSKTRYSALLASE